MSCPAHGHELTPSVLNLRFFDFGNNVVRSCDENSSGADTVPWGEHPIASAGRTRLNSKYESFTLSGFCQRHLDRRRRCWTAARNCRRGVTASPLNRPITLSRSRMPKWKQKLTQTEIPRSRCRRSSRKKSMHFMSNWGKRMFVLLRNRIRRSKRSPKWKPQNKLARIKRLTSQKNKDEYQIKGFPRASRSQA